MFSQSFKNYHFGFWLFYLVFNFKSGGCQKCKEDAYYDPKFEISVQGLQVLPHNNLPPRLNYVVEKGIKKIVINCSSFQPSLWEFNTAKVYIGQIKVSFHVNIYDDYMGSKICYTTSILLEEFDESITGLYSCANRFSSKPIAIYSANVNNKSEIGSFLQRGQQFQIDALAFRQEITQDKWIVLPCGQNYPKRAILEWNNDKVSQIGNTSLRISKLGTLRCRGLFCADFKSIFNVPEMLKTQGGFSIRCKSGNRINTNDSVLIVIPPPPDSIAFPEERKVNLTSSHGQKIKFTCQSIHPIRFETDYKYEKVIVTTEGLHFYKYKSEIELFLPNKEQISSAENILFNNWINTNVTVSCINSAGNILYSWSYSLFIALAHLHISTKETVADAIFNLKRGICISLDPDSVKLYFVPCSTYTECQMKAPLLYSSESHRLNTTKHYVREYSLQKFKLPQNVSGMLRCVGFQKDVFSIFYPNIKAVEGDITHDAIAPTEKVVEVLISKAWTPIPIVSVDATIINEGEFITAKCQVQLMIVVTHPFWIFLFKNNTEHAIPSASFINHTVEEVSEVFMVSTTLKIPSTDVIGLACNMTLIETAPPIVWKNGALVENQLPIISIMKRCVVTLEVKAQVSRNNELMLWIARIALGFLLVVVAAVSAWIYVRQKSLRNIVDKLTPEEIEYFLKGRPDCISDSEIANTNAQNLAYDTSKEIPLKDLEIDYKTVLGSGEFGIVFKGTLKNQDSICVAIKTLKAGANAHYLKSAMAELKVMLYIKHHANIVRVIGASTQDLMEHQLFVVMEYCSSGDLLSYIRKNANNFVNEVSKGMIIRTSTFDVAQDDLPDYKNIQAPKAGLMSTSDLIKWSMQISNGMRYISGMNIIHGDLAARNILLDANLTVKISDFGLAKNLYQYSIYVRHRNIPLPWRWLAVESLNFTEISKASDVWAFAITLWEIFSLGVTPYPGQEYNAEFVKMLTNGFRMGLPEFASYDIFSIIQDCWKKEPSLRPNFDKIYRRFDAMGGLYINM